MGIVKEQLPLPHPAGILPPLSLWPAAGAQAPVLLIAPALGTPAGAYRRLAEGLQQAGIGAAVIELRGVGQSALRAGRDTDWGYLDLVDQELQAALSALRARLPQAPLAMLGHSLGGHLALLHRARHPAQAAPVLLVAAGTPYHGAYQGWQRAGVWAFGKLTQAGVALFGWFPGDRIGFGGRQPRALMREWAGFVTAGHLRPAGHGGGNPLAAGAGAPPVFALSLPGDRLAPPAATRHLLELAGVDPGNVRKLDGSCPRGHFGWLREPSAVVAALAAALAETFAPGRAAHGKRMAQEAPQH